MPVKSFTLLEEGNPQHSSPQQPWVSWSGIPPQPQSALGLVDSGYVLPQLWCCRTLGELAGQDWQCVIQSSLELDCRSQSLLGLAPLI